MDPRQAFNESYWPAQPPAVQAIRGTGDLPGKSAVAAQLATQGYTIDVPIMVWGWEPYLVMKMRQDFGYTWVPSALMSPVQLAPGIVEPGLIPYDPTNPPPGAIIVTTTPLPPFVRPLAPAPPAAAPTSLVGKDEGGGYFQAFAAAIGKLTDGQEYDEPRGVFIYHQSESPFAPKGIVAWFTAKSAA